VRFDSHGTMAFTTVSSSSTIFRIKNQSEQTVAKANAEDLPPQTPLLGLPKSQSTWKSGVGLHENRLFVDGRFSVKNSLKLVSHTEQVFPNLFLKFLL